MLESSGDEDVRNNQDEFAVFITNIQNMDDQELNELYDITIEVDKYQNNKGLEECISVSDLKAKFSDIFCNPQDLYYSLKKCNLKFTKQDYNFKVTITDTYDFNYEQLESIFKTYVNNWGYLCYKTGVLEKINVKIIFYEVI